MRRIWRIVSASLGRFTLMFWSGFQGQGPRLSPPFHGAVFCVRVITDPVQRCCPVDAAPQPLFSMLESLRRHAHRSLKRFCAPTH